MKLRERKINRFFSAILIAVFGTVFALLLLPFYKDGKMILGSEGAYYTDFILLFKNYGFTWYPYGTGIIATTVNYVFHLISLQALFNNERLVNFVMIYSLYFLPFLAMFLLAIQLKLKPLLAFLIALFYLTNPFTANFLKSVNQWSMLAAYILPAFFLIILKFYEDNWKLFFFFGIHSLFFAFTNANPPTMVLYQIAIIFFVILISLYKEQKINIPLMIQKYLWVVSSFILFNFWWIINWFYILPDAQQGYTKEFAISWLRGSQQFIPAFWRTLNLTSLLQYPIKPDYDYFAFHYSYFFTPVLLSIPILIVIYFLFRKRLGEKYHLILGLMLVIIGFLSKGVNGLFGSVYEFMVMNLPFFNIFKSAGEKWGTLFIFLLTLYLIFIFRELKKDRLYSLIVILLTIYILYNAVPFVTGNFLPDYKYSGVVIGSKRFLDKPEYKELKNKLNNDPEQYRVLSLPGSNNYQVALHIEGKKFYTGNDPILSNTTKPFIAPYTRAPLQDFDSLYDAIPKPSYPNILGLFNIKKIVVNKDMYPWFGFREKMLPSQTEEFLDKKLTVLKGDSIDLYDTNDYFLPRFYIPENIFYAPNASQKDLSLVVGVPEFKRRSAVLLGKALKDVAQKNAEKIKEKPSVYIMIPEVRSTDEKKIREGNIQVNPAGVLFPYVRWRPGSYFYKFVLKKEQKAKDEANSQTDLIFDRYLFYAAKRISEIQKWDSDLSDQEFESILGRYEEEMQSAIGKLDQLITEEDDAYPFLLKIEVSFVAHEKRLLDVLKGDFGLKDNQRLNLAKQTFEKIASRLEEIVQEKFSASKYYSTTTKGGEYDLSLLKNIVKKKFTPLDRYYFAVSEDGEYELLVEKPNVPPGWKLVETNPRKNASSSSEFTLQESFDYWDFFGRPYLDRGRHYFSFIGTSKNLLNPNFTFLDRLDQEDINGISMTLLKKTPASEKIVEWQPRKTYKLSFKYRGDKGKLKVNLAEYLSGDIDETWYKRGVEDKPGRGNFAVNEILELDNDWKDFVSIIQSSRKVDFANIFFLTNLSSDSSQPAQIKDLKLEELFEPKIILTKPLPNKFPLKMPKITFQKINPTKYLVRVDEATTDYLLVFSESFHRGWKAYIEPAATFVDNRLVIETYFAGDIKEIESADSFFDKKILQTLNKKPLPEDRHILINGYANSWLINPKDANNHSSYTIIIEYGPQKLFYVGAMITIATMFGCFIFFIVGYKKNKTND